MNKPFQRKPVSNFFVKRGLQFAIILKIFFIVLFTSLLTTGVLVLIYTDKSQGGNFFYMSNDIMQDLELTSIIGIILPAVITAQFVTLVIAIGIGLFSSRKAAVPIYKLEKWALQLKKGRLKTQLGFREIKEMKDLTIQCNAMTDTYRRVFMEIDKACENILEEELMLNPSTRNEVLKIKAVLEHIDFKEEPKVS